MGTLDGCGDEAITLTRRKIAHFSGAPQRGKFIR
jgi:hypothetical protein